MTPTGLVYRDHVPMRSEAALAADVAAALAAEAPEAALLAAAAFEGALADAGDERAAAVAALTDAAAAALLRPTPLASLAAAVTSYVSPRPLRAPVPEGFAYYALSPRIFAAAVAAAVPASPVLVVGLRTIGTALSAMVRARIAAEGRLATRLTVRPTGHPYARTLALAPAAARAIRQAVAADAALVVVDEGPGHSGSSFLAVAEALLAAGAPAARITLVGTRPLDAAGTRALVAPDAAQRFARFRYLAAPPAPLPGRDLSGGTWRRHLPLAAKAPVWPWAERRKYLTGAGRGRVIHRFAGLGTHGAGVAARAAHFAALGFTPPLRGACTQGFLPLAFIAGRPLGRITAADVAHLGRYLAARARLAATVDDAAQAQLCEMARLNLTLELGPAVEGPALPLERPVVPDARLCRHEWVRDAGGRLWKLDAFDHGDDHFFPGPTDIAWDLAGAVVEWQLDATDTATLLAQYQRGSGDDARARLPAYLLAYAAFRARYCVMAAHGAGRDGGPWQQARQRYVEILRHAFTTSRARSRTKQV